MSAKGHAVESFGVVVVWWTGVLCQYLVQHPQLVGAEQAGHMVGNHNLQRLPLPLVDKA